MKRISVILFFVLLSTPYLVSFQGEFNTRSKMQGLMMYQFASRYIEWPSAYKDGNFIVGILGESPLYNELTSVASTKKVLNQTMEVKKFMSVSEISKCHMLYVSGDKADNFQEIINKLKGSSTLIVTEKDGILKQGAVINFVIVDNKQRFDINKTAIEKQELKVGSELLRLAINVI